MQMINWGIIGCGDVTEVKSGPAFHKVPDSRLVAVMRRREELAKDYAMRHDVPKWYGNAQDLIDDPDINAIYIATPPSSHLEYTLAAIEAGKPVYVEKPMTLNYDEALKIDEISRAKNVKVVVAHYRRAQPLFKKIKSLLESKIIGDILLANLVYYTPPLKETDLTVDKFTWRVDPAIAGGGLFHDIAPHPIDLMYYFFGEVETAKGLATKQGSLYNADDLVTGNILFKNGVVFTGAWCFNASPATMADEVEIIGAEGKISFSVFKNSPVRVGSKHGEEVFNFDPLPHVQQPMIAEVVDYFLGRGPNPDSAAQGAEVMKIMDAFVAK